ncbi:N-6 DNA methylase, partial [bacterium]|nr:N-6 DNA methylase [bacterium]
FSFMPAEILGNVYEQFLGKVIRLTKGHQAKVEEKPEVRKAGGVYYTPAYIVDYIVENTVGKLCGGKKPKDIAKLKILDPACGSGSFLLGAFQYLLDYHLKYYTDEMDKTGKVPKPPSQTGKGKKKRDRQAIYQGQDGGWYLTTTEKKRILLNNIYGVDIDSQAVEVTKLSLLLKVLENENKDTLHQQMFLIKERALPDLSDNVKCGNSLIASDFYTQSEQTLMFDDEEQYRINAFDWDVEFPDIMKGRNPGFDAVIGNPPYRRELDYKHLMDEIAKTKFGQKYRAPRMDLWYYFIHRSLELLKTGGQLSFIVNAYWVAATGSEKLIKTLREKAQIDEIFFFKKLRVFTNVSGQHMIIRITNNNDKNTTLIKLVEPTSEISAEPFVTGNSSVNEFMKAHDQLFTENKVDLEPPAGELLSKIGKWPILNLLGKVRQGIAENPSVINRKTNEKFGNIWEIGEGVFTIRPENVKKLNLSKTEKKLLRAYHDLCDLGRYQIASKPSFFIIYSTRYTCPDINRYPKIRDHLKRFKVIMNARRETQKGSNKWWHLHWPRDEEIWKSAKIMSIQMGKRPMFVPSLNPVYVPFSVNVFLPYQETREHIHYITGVLNSRLIFKWYQHYAKRRGVGLEINGNVLSKTPIRTIDFTDPADKARHDKMVKLVSNMLTLHKRIQESKTPHEREMIQRRIVATDRQIDNLVYELYDLTDEEVAVVEGS